MTGSIVRDGEWPDTFEMVVVRDSAFIEINTASQCRTGGIAGRTNLKNQYSVNVESIIKPATEIIKQFPYASEKRRIYL